LQAGRPSRSARHGGVNRLGRQGRRKSRQETPSLVSREAQLGEVHLAELPAGSHPVLRQIQIPPGEQHDVQPAGQMFQEPRERGCDIVLIVHNLHIVDD
jgi:hypothetical protein